MLKDFDDFTTEVSWFIKAGDNIDISPGVIEPGKDFIDTFPLLYSLINRASILNVSVNKKNYKLISWTTSDGKSCGWLCEFESKLSGKIEILPEHQILIDNIGGIRESYNQPEEAFTNNQNFLFLKSECKRGHGYWTDYYHDRCGEYKIQPIPVSDLVSFVYEANGGQVLYNLTTKQVYLFSHDHSFDYVTFLDGQPEYTFHLINNVSNFVDYVEALAKQWLLYINTD